jgi:hypothetical protein
MSRRPELDRLAAARPPLLDHSELVVDADEEDRMFRQILSTSRPVAGSARTWRRSSRTGAGRQGAARRHSPRLVIGVLAALAATAGGVAAATSLPGSARSGAAGAGSAPAGQAGAHRGAAGAHAPIISAETVADRTAAAVTSAVRKDILYTRTQYARDAGVPWYMATIREWSHGVWAREQSFSRRGALTEDASAVVQDGQRVRRFVDYTTKTWQYDTIPVASYGPGPSVRQKVSILLGHLADARETRSITQLTVQGRPEYQVRFTWPAMRYETRDGWTQQFTQPMFLPGVRGGQASTGATVWLDAATYLPVRVTVNGPAGRVLAVEGLSWLPPGRASRAELRPAPVPADFRNATPPAR